MPFKTPFKLGHRLSSFRKTQQFQRLDREHSSGGGGSPPGPTTWTWLDGSTHIWRDGSEAEWLTPTATFALSGTGVATGSPVLGTPALTLQVASSPYIDTAGIGGSAYAAWSLNKVVSTATQSVTLRRADLVESTFGFDGDSLDVAAIEGWSAGQDAFIKTIHDQTGNGHDLTNSAPAEQPQLVSSGSVIMDREYGLIPEAIQSANQNMHTAGLPAGFSKNDFTLFTVQTVTTNSGAIFSDGGGINSIQIRSEPGGFRIFNGTEDEVTWGSGGDRDIDRMHRYGWISGLHAITNTDTEIKTFRNRMVINKFTGTYLPGATTKLTLGTGDQFWDSGQRWTETILYPALSDADVRTLTDARNNHYGLAPTDQAIPGPYITEPWCQDLYEEMATVVEADVTYTLAAPTHDGTFDTEDQIADLQLDAGNLNAGSMFSLRSPARFFVLDNGSGAGLFANGTWRIFNYGTNTGSEANVLADWYSRDIYTGSGEGNPYYQNTNLAKRAMMLASANLLGGLYYRNIDPGYNSYADFVGGALEGTIYAYRKCKNSVSQKWQDAIYNGAVWYARIIRYTGARHDNANMDLKCLPALAMLWAEAEAKGDAATKAVCTQAARKVLFGSTTGTLATSEYDQDLGDWVGVADPSGNIRENSSPETTYMGHSIKEAALAYSFVWGQAEWSFLLDLIEAYVELEELQTFDDITTFNGENFNGPSGYASRTSGSMWQGQGNSQDKFAVIAHSQARKHHARHRLNLTSAATMAADVQSTILGLTNAGVPFPVSESGTAAAHTNGYDWSNHTWTVDTATNEIILDNPHSLQVNDLVCPFNRIRNALPDGPTGNELKTFQGDLLHVIAVNGQRIKVSATQGGPEVVIDNEGTNPSYSPHYFLPIVYLTNSPVYAWDSNTAKWAKVGDAEGRIWEVDEANDIIVVEADIPAIASGSAVDYEVRPGPRELSALEHWPSLPAGHPPAGWHAALKALVDGNDAATFLRTETGGANYNINLANQAWAFRGTSVGGRDYAFFAYGSDVSGRNAGFNPAVPEAIAFQDYGIAAMSRRFDKDTSDDAWSNIDRWVCWHTWGLDDKATPTAFSTQRGNSPNSSITYNTEDATPNIVITRTIGLGGPGGGSGLENNDEITGTFTEQYTLSPATNDDGLRVELELSSDQSDSVKELWHTIPIYLREADQSMTDAQIQYWDAAGETWLNLSTTLVSFRYLRTARNHGSGDVYVWYDFSTTVEGKLSSSVKEQAYQGSVRSRNVLINVHSTTPGSTALLPSVGAPKQLNYEIVGTDPGLTPSNPTLTVLEPTAADEFFTNGIWYTRTTIDFYSTNPGAVLEYSTTSTDGSNGTWAAVGSLSNVGGNEWEYIGEDVPIPSGLTFVRVVAVDDLGSTTVAVAVSSRTPTLNLDDGFLGANGTVIDGSYSGWNSNSLVGSPVWNQRHGVAEIQNNAATQQSPDSWNASIDINCGTDNKLIKAKITYLNSTGGSQTPGLGIATGIVSYYQMNAFILRNTTDIRLREDTSLVDQLTGFTAVNVNDEIEFTLQHINGVIVAKARNLTTATTIGYVRNWVPRSGNNCGLTFATAYNETDDFEIWN